MKSSPEEWREFTRWKLSCKYLQRDLRACLLNCFVWLHENRLPKTSQIPKLRSGKRWRWWAVLSCCGRGFLAHQSALKANVPLALAWNIALGISLLVMIWITVRRMRRFKRALDETAKNSRRGVPGMPWMQIPDRAEKSGKKKGK